MTINEPAQDGQRVRMPAWIPGSYLIRDFSRHVLDLQASCQRGPVAVSKSDKSTWKCAPCAGPLTLVYRLYAYDLSVRGAYLDTTRAYFNGVCVFMAALGQEQTACTLVLAGDAYPAGWEVATSMNPVEADTRGFGAYEAADYDELIDHPVEIAPLDTARFDVDGVAHHIALSGDERCHMPRLRQDLSKICAQHSAMFGANMPIDRYLFLVYATDKNGGGLEHRWSNSIIIGRDHLPSTMDAPVDKRYCRFLGVLSHEYFHLWNVKRIKPAAFEPFDLSREQHTTLLWVFEGITSYYDDLAMVRAGVIDVATYLGLLGEAITGVWQTPGRHRMSLAESSFDAWTKLYKRDENAPNALISYYSKGSLVALALDLSIREQSAGKYCLDDVMRAFWARYGEGSGGVAEDGFEALAAEVTGLALDGFFDAMIRGTQDPPLASLLSHVGVDMRLSSARPTAGSAAGQYLPALGIRCRGEQTGASIMHVLDGGAAQAAGLSAGDKLLAVNGLRVGRANLVDLLGAPAAGEALHLHVFRRDQLLTFDLSPSEPVKDVATLSLDAQASEGALHARQAWLASC